MVGDVAQETVGAAAGSRLSAASATAVFMYALASAKHALLAEQSSTQSR
jgi:hypothetical protein